MNKGRLLFVTGLLLAVLCLTSCGTGDNTATVTDTVPAADPESAPGQSGGAGNPPSAGSQTPPSYRSDEETTSEEETATPSSSCDVLTAEVVAEIDPDLASKGSQNAPIGCFYPPEGVGSPDSQAILELIPPPGEPAPSAQIQVYCEKLVEQSAATAAEDGSSVDDSPGLGDPELATENQEAAYPTGAITTYNAVWFQDGVCVNLAYVRPSAPSDGLPGFVDWAGAVADRL